MPPWYVWFVVTNTVLMALIGGFMLSLRAGFSGGKKMQSLENEIAMIKERHSEYQVTVGKRFDDEGRELSKWATYIQGMEHRIREEYVTKENLRYLMNGKTPNS
jgi:xylose isomerase